MFSPIIAALIALLFFACGAPSQGELDTELGALEQGMSTKFSSLYTHGVHPSNGTKALVSSGCGVNNCLLMGKGLIRFKVTGTDPYETSNPQLSWKQEARAALKHDFKNQTIGYGYPWPYGTAVEEDTASTWLEVTSGCCATAVSTNKIIALACIQWTLGSSPIVSESLAGSYKRFTGTAKLIFDNDAIDEVFFDGINSTIPLPTMGDDKHEIIEHAAHALAAAFYGSGIYSANVNNSWSSPLIYTNGYTHAGYTVGEVCRAGNWSSTAASEFTQQSGSCPDNF